MEHVVLFVCKVNEVVNNVMLQIYLLHGFISQFLKSNIDYVQPQGDLPPLLPPNKKILGACLKIPKTLRTYHTEP